MNSNLQIRIDKKTKERARKELKKAGLDMSSAIKLFLGQVIVQKKIPFEIRTENGFTPQQEEQIVRETQEALKRGKSYASVEELHRELLK